MALDFLPVTYTHTRVYTHDTHTHTDLVLLNENGFSREYVADIGPGVQSWKKTANSLTKFATLEKKKWGGGGGEGRRKI